MGKRAKIALRGVALISVVAASAAQAADAPAIGVAPPISPPSLAPAPLGVFGDALPGAGNLLITLSPQFVGSAHSLIGTQGVSPQQIVATTPWYWNPQVPLRLVPQRRLDELQSMTLSYGVTKDISVVLTTGWIEKHVDLMTFYGTSGIIPRGMSNVGTESLQDFTTCGDLARLSGSD